MNAAAPAPGSGFKTPSKSWVIIEGIVFLLIGLAGITFPYAMTIAVEQVLGILCVIGGVFALGGALWGGGAGHRLSGALSGIFLIATGIVLIMWVKAGVLALTLVLAVLFILEGVFCILAALAKKDTLPQWPLLLLNGIVAIVLGGMLYAQWPSSAAWAIGLLYGINMIFSGATFLTVGFSMPGKKDA